MTEDTTVATGRFDALAQKVSLPVALGILIFAAVLIVAAGYAVYWQSTERKYDIARPGQPTQSAALGIEDGEADATSPVDKQAVKRKADYLKEELRTLEGMNGFEAGSLSDRSLGLTAGD